MIIELSQTLQQTRPHLADWISEAAYWCQSVDPDIDLDGLHISVRQSRKLRNWTGAAWPHSVSLDRRRHKRRKHPSGRVTLTIGKLVPRAEVARITAHELRHIGQFARGRKLIGHLTCMMGDRESECDSLIFEGKVMRAMNITDCLWWRDLGWVYKPKSKIVHVKGISDFVNVRVSDRIPKDVIVIEPGGRKCETLYH